MQARQGTSIKLSVVKLAAFAALSGGVKVWVYGWRASHVWVSGGEHRTIIEYAKKKGSQHVAKPRVG